MKKHSPLKIKKEGEQMLIKMRKRRKSRILRTYSRIAQKDYTCVQCETPIFPGDYYHAEIWVCNKRLWVKRFHDACPIDPDEEERERLRQKREAAQRNFRSLVA